MSRTRPLTAFALAAGLALAATACGGDDDDTTPATDAPAATAAPAATTAPATDAPTSEAPGTDAPTTAAASGDAAAFCAAELEVEAAVNSEGDPSAAIAAASAAAPADVKAAFDELVAAFAEGPESEAFSTAYDGVITWMSDNCGYTVIDATATEYAYAGVPEAVAAGPAIINMTNLGDEFHEFILFRKADGVTDAPVDIVSLPEEEMAAKATFTAAAFGPPQAVAHGVANLTPGDYFAICFLPEHATPEIMAQMEGPESPLPEGAGPPHFTHGMFVEFTVTG